MCWQRKGPQVWPGAGSPQSIGHSPASSADPGRPRRCSWEGGSGLTQLLPPHGVVTSTVNLYSAPGRIPTAARFREEMGLACAVHGLSCWKPADGWPLRVQMVCRVGPPVRQAPCAHWAAWWSQGCSAPVQSSALSPAGLAPHSGLLFLCPARLLALLPCALGREGMIEIGHH